MTFLFCPVQRRMRRGVRRIKQGSCGEKSPYNILMASLDSPVKSTLFIIVEGVHINPQAQEKQSVPDILSHNSEMERR